MSTDVDAATDYEAVIGLEVHVRARRPPRSCSAAAPTSSAPSPTRTSVPVCLGLPGSLPVLNEQAVELRPALRRGGAPARARRGRSSPARTTSIPTCRRTTRSRSTKTRSPSTAGSRSTARASASNARTSKRTPARPLHVGGGGRIHEAELLARRLQPRRRPAHGDREPARHPQRRAGARVRVGAARRAAGRSACPT